MKEKTYKLIADIADEDIQGGGQRLKEDLGLASLGLVTLLIEIEDDFDIVINESDLDPTSLVTVGDIVELVGRYV